MARYLFGLDGGSNVTDTAGNKVSRTCTIWTARTGGTQVTDLQYPNGTAVVNGVVSPQSHGPIGFLGPNDDVDEKWADFGDGVRWHVPLVAVADVALAILEARAVLLTSLGDPSGVATLDESGRLVETQVPLEAIQDVIATMLSGGTHTGITFTYDDETGTLSSVAAPEGSVINGESAYEIAVRNGFSGTESQWLESLKQPGLPAALDQVNFYRMLPSDPWTDNSGTPYEQPARAQFRPRRFVWHCAEGAEPAWSFNAGDANSTYHDIVDVIESTEEANPTDTTKPTAPTNLSVHSKTETSITVAFTGSTDNVGVVKYRVQAHQGGGAAVAQGEAASSPVTVAGLAPSTTYSLYASAIDAAGNVSDTSFPALSVTTTGSVLAAPTITVTPISGDPSRATLTWNSPGGTGVEYGWDAPGGVPVAHWQTQTTSLTGSTVLTNFAPQSTYHIYAARIDNGSVGPRDTETLVTASAPITPPTDSTTGLPTGRVAGVYIRRWETPYWGTLASKGFDYGVAFVAQGDGGGGGGLEFTWLNGESDANFRASVAANPNKPVFVSVGGGGGDDGNIYITNSTQETQAFNSLVSIIDRLTAHGVEWNIEAGSEKATVSSMLNVSRRLKAHYAARGKNLLFHLVPRPYETNPFELGRAMQQEGLLTLFSLQFYDAPEYSSYSLGWPYMDRYIAKAINTYGIPANKMIAGFIIPPYSGVGEASTTLIRQYWDSIKAKWPTFRGVFVFDGTIEAASGYDFSTEVIPYVKNS